MGFEWLAESVRFLAPDGSEGWGAQQVCRHWGPSGRAGGNLPESLALREVAGGAKLSDVCDCWN